MDVRQKEHEVLVTLRRVPSRPREKTSKTQYPCYAKIIPTAAQAVVTKFLDAKLYKNASKPTNKMTNEFIHTEMIYCIKI